MLHFLSLGNSIAYIPKYSLCHFTLWVSVFPVCTLTPTPLISPPSFSRLLPDEWEIRPHQNMLYLNMQALARISWILKA